MVSQQRFRSVRDAVCDLVGDSMRVLGVVDPESRGLDDDLSVIRPDVAETYSDEALDDIGDELVFELWERDHRDDIYALGETHHVLHRFDDALVLICYHRDEGLVLSLDAEVETSIGRVVDTICDELDRDR